MFFARIVPALFMSSVAAWSQTGESIRRKNRRNLNSQPSSCVRNDVGLSLADATIAHNNLGGVGPDSGEPEMRFENVGMYNGITLDLVLSIKDGENYEVANNANNGMICGPTDGNPDTTSCNTGGDFGQINMLRNRQSTVVFTIKDHDTGDDVVLPAFVFSAFDIDEGVVEHYRVHGWETAQYDHTNSEANFSETNDEYCGDFINQGETCLYAHSTHVGHGCDNPHDAFDLGVVNCKDNHWVDQKARSFQVTFVNKSSFELFIYYEAKEGTNGRNVVFAFNSGHSDDCTLPPTPAPTPPPKVSSCVKNDVGLSLKEATIVHNNLGGVGPDVGGDQVMKFTHVGEYNGMILDLVLSIKDGESYKVANNLNNGMLCGPTDDLPDTTSCNTGGDFGQINMLRNRQSTIVFTIQEHATGNPVVLPAFVFSAFDIDEGVVEHYRIHGWDTAQYDHTNSEAYFSETDEEYCGEFVNQGETCLYAHSTHVGHGCDNPTNAFDLGVVNCMDNHWVDQKARSFQVTFVNKSSFELFIYYEAEEGTNGRNVVFAFNSGHSADCDDDDDDVAAPTSSPTTAEWFRNYGQVRNADFDNSNDDDEDPDECIEEDL